MHSPATGLTALVEQAVAEQDHMAEASHIYEMCACGSRHDAMMGDACSNIYEYEGGMILWQTELTTLYCSLGISLMTPHAPRRRFGLMKTAYYPPCTGG